MKLKSAGNFAYVTLEATWLSKQDFVQTTQKQTVFRKWCNFVWISVLLHILSVLLKNANQNGSHCVKMGVKFRFASTAQFGDVQKRFIDALHQNAYTAYMGFVIKICQANYFCKIKACLLCDEITKEIIQFKSELCERQIK